MLREKVHPDPRDPRTSDTSTVEVPMLYPTGFIAPQRRKTQVLGMRGPPYSQESSHSSSKRSERFVRFEPNVRSERVRYFSERETNVQALKRLINLIAVK